MEISQEREALLLEASFTIVKGVIHPDRWRSMVRVSAHTLKGLEFDSQSGSCTWVAGSIPGPGQGTCRSHRCFSR